MSLQTVVLPLVRTHARSMELVLLDFGDDPLVSLIKTEGYIVRRELRKGASVVLVRVAHRLDPEDARRIRLSLGSRGRIVVVCSADDVVRNWLSLREAGMEPKGTTFLYSGLELPAYEAVIVALPAKRGGLRVESHFG